MTSLNLTEKISSSMCHLGAADIAELVNDCEARVLDSLRVGDRLRSLLASARGLHDFAAAFYFVRYDFCRLNFVVGARCESCDEMLYSGLIENLYEEMGGRRGPSHNELYRDFLQYCGVKSESELVEPAFANRFNKYWDDFCRKAPLDNALLAIAIYEIFDNPDYKVLLDAVRAAGVSGKTLRFFAVHAGAKHFDLFNDLVTRMLASGKLQAVSEAGEFVLQTQARMWRSLLAHLEHEAARNGAAAPQPHATSVAT